VRGSFVWGALWASILIFLLSLAPSQESFDEYIRRELGGFKREKEEYRKYLEEVNKEFEEYKRIVREEFKRFKKELGAYWDEPEVSTRKKWVQYSDDLKVKRVFDFEKEELRIEIIAKDKVSLKTIKRHIDSFAKETMRDAFVKDRFLKRVERRLRIKSKHIRFSKVPDRPVIGSLIQEDPSELLKRGNFTTVKNSKGYTVNRFKVKIPPKRILKKAKELKPIVRRESSKWNLPQELIFAVIHTESYFNPFATSYVPAYGLMQIVPRYAGREVSKFLWGRPVLLSPSYLYNPENNIVIGSAYLYLLYSKYFSGVRDPQSRLYMSIAAYNTGPGNVARALTGTRNLEKAKRVANSLNPRDVYRILLRNLPYAETRDYLRKVSSRMTVYKNL